MSSELPPLFGSAQGLLPFRSGALPLPLEAGFKGGTGIVSKCKTKPA